MPLSLFGTKRLVGVRAFLLLPLLTVSSYGIAVVWRSRQSYPVTETTSETKKASELQCIAFLMDAGNFPAIRETHSV